MQRLRHPLIARPLVMLVTTAVLMVQSHQLWAQTADPIVSGAQAGQALGRQVFPDASRLGTADANGNVTLFPGQAGQLHIGAAELFPGSGSVSTDQLRRTFGNPDAAEALGRQTQNGLSSQSGQTGNAYRTVTGSRANMPPDLTGDPLWGTTADTVSNLESIAANFAHCTTTRAFVPGTFTAHVPDLRTCDRVYDPGGTVTVAHRYVAGLIRPLDAYSSYTSCGEGCLDMWLGQVGDNYWRGRCTVFEQRVRFEVLQPNAITAAEIVHAKWDDYMQIWLGGSKVWSGPNGLFPPETSGACELGTNWDQAISVDVTSQLRRNGTNEFLIRVSVTDQGEGYARLRIHYDPAKLVSGDDWSTNEDVARIAAARDGFCTAAVTCNDMPALDQDGCTMVSGVRICPNMLPGAESASMATFVNPLCRSATANLRCSFTGQMRCWTDAQGNQQCPTNTGGVDTCAALRQDTACGFVRTECVEGAAGSSGTCYVYQDVYDCGYTTQISTVTPTTGISCPGPIRCMGTDCTNPTFESNHNFAQAAAALEALQMLGQDGTCTAEGAAAGTCVLFPGDARSCKRAVGGMVDCCQHPGGVSLGQYLQLVMAIGKVDSAIMSMEGTSQLRGAWEVLRYPVTSTWQAAREAWTSTVNSVTGSTASTATDASAQGLLEGAKQAMLRQTAEWTMQLFGPEATNMLFSTAASSTAAVGPAVGADGVLSSGTLQLGGGEAIVGTALGWVMWAYMAYQVFTILVNLIWPCEESEFQLGVQRQLKSCHLIGSYCATSVGACLERRESYCCFNSPLSRILQEQIRPQLGLDFGTAKSPRCEGLTIAQFGSADWTRVDLTEWVGILNAEGLMPDPTTVSLQSLTGSGRTVLNAASPNGTRSDAVTRTQERLQGVNTQSLQNQSLRELRNTLNIP